MEVNIQDIDIGDMDAQLEMIGTLPHRTYRKRSTEPAIASKHRTTTQHATFKVQPRILSHKPLAKQFPRPTDTTWNAWRLQIRRKAAEEGVKSLNPREARILYQLKDQDKKSGKIRALRQKQATARLKQAGLLFKETEKLYNLIDTEDNIHVARRILELESQLKAVEEERNMYAEWIIYKRIGVNRWDWLKKQDNTNNQWGADYMPVAMRQALIKFDAKFKAEIEITPARTTNRDKLQQEAKKKLLDRLMPLTTKWF